MISNYLNENIQEINEYLHQYMDKLENNTPKSLKEAMEYSLFASGKRIRPILLLEISRTFGEDIKNSIPLACAIEMIHTYSLIHDDLPPMDDDEYRRGKLTSHNVFGEDMAILAGDALLNYAFEIMIEHSLQLTADELAHYLRGLNEIVFASGSRGMIKGQVEDTVNEQRIDVDKLNEINAHKTGQLFKASVLAGAMVHGVSENILTQLSDYSKEIGSAFQIVDDILDVEGDEKKLGKKLRSDEKNNKKTYVNLYGIEESKRIINISMERALRNLKNCNIDNKVLVELTKFICVRDY